MICGRWVSRADQMRADISLAALAETAWRMQAVALREAQLRKLVDDLDSFVHSSALTTAAWLAQLDALIFPQRPASVHASDCSHSRIPRLMGKVLGALLAEGNLL